MDDYCEFGRDYAVEIDAWRRHWSSNYLSTTHGGVGISGGASSDISEGASSNIRKSTNGAAGVASVGTSSGTVSIAGRSMNEDASGIPLFSLIPQFFKRELRRRVRDATLMSDESSTLTHVFALYKKIELNMVEERDMTSTSCISHNTTQFRPMGGASGSRGIQTRSP
ncbi:hypothetical protein AXG93_4032s1020 [Marchantia polymorpha subsp. ruderalis]|uniref:Uncharacterized protein n=1 Tax=Marchantia polymorpha subsp. ruderalis TaxID=1480154 RepID=A0A176WMA7_MARPO|nr:hypothetical protein AXG93_4032s1020 [Marchantia polymorpha subsp. ruderalis]